MVGILDLITAGLGIKSAYDTQSAQEDQFRRQSELDADRLRRGDAGIQVGDDIFNKYNPVTGNYESTLSAPTQALLEGEQGISAAQQRLREALLAESGDLPTIGQAADRFQQDKTERQAIQDRAIGMANDNAVRTSGVPGQDFSGFGRLLGEEFKSHVAPTIGPGTNEGTTAELGRMFAERELPVAFGSKILQGSGTNAFQTSTATEIAPQRLGMTTNAVPGAVGPTGTANTANILGSLSGLQRADTQYANNSRILNRALDDQGVG